MDPKRLVTIDWRITKATTDDSGVMRWKATTTKFSRDIQGDMVFPEFYLKARQRMKSGVVPKPFFSAAHFTLERECRKCGLAYKSLTDYICPGCGTERLIGGVADNIWIDGRQPKAEGIWYPTRLGKSLFAAAQEDIRLNKPLDERMRISMGFYPDLDGVIVPKSDCRDFFSGWIEHFAGTMVPVIPETPIEEAYVVHKSAATAHIKTRYDDAVALFRGDKSLADELQQMEHHQLKRKSANEPVLIFKSDLPVPQDDADAELQELETEDATAQDQDSQQVQTMNKQSDPRVKSLLILDSVAVDQMAEITKSIADLQEIVGDNPLLQDSIETLLDVQKAIVAAPGNEKAEILARAANLIRSVRDYAHTLLEQPAPVPPTPVPPQTLPENMPQPPIGTVDDQTSTLQDLQAMADNEDNAASQGLATPDETSYAQGEAASPMEGEQPLTTDDQQAGPESPEEEQFDEAAGDDESGEEGQQEGTEDGDEPGEDQLGDEGVGPEGNQQPSDGGEEEAGGEGASLEQSPDSQQDDTDQAMQDAGAEAQPEMGENTAPDEQQPPVDMQNVAKKTADKQVPPPPTSPEEPAPGAPPVPGKKKKGNPFAKSTAVGNSVTERTQPSAAVKSVAMHPAEAYVGGWADVVGGVLRDPSLTRTQKRMKVEKALQQFAGKIVGIIDATTPVTQQDLVMVVNEEVRKALAEAEKKYKSETEALREEIDSVRVAKIQEEVQKTLAGVNARGGRVVRKSLTMQPQVNAHVAAVPEQMALSDSNTVKGVSAGDVARASVTAASQQPYRY